MAIIIIIIYQHLPQQPAVARRQRAEESSMWSTVWGPSDVKAGSEQFVDCGIFIWGLTFWIILGLYIIILGIKWGVISPRLTLNISVNIGHLLVSILDG